MAQRRTCDACGHTTTEMFGGGWGSLTGTNGLGQYVSHDLCPRCSGVMQMAMVDLQRRFARTDAPSLPEGQKNERGP